MSDDDDLEHGDEDDYHEDLDVHNNDNDDEDDEDAITYCHQYFFLNLLEDC